VTVVLGAQFVGLTTQEWRLCVLVFLVSWPCWQASLHGLGEIIGAHPGRGPAMIPMPALVTERLCENLNLCGWRAPVAFDSAPLR
jgi:hypothetical protein